MLLGAIAFSPPTDIARANNLSGRASFRHSISGGDDNGERQRLSQFYSTGFSSTMTDAISLTGNLGYNKNWQEQRGSSSSVQSSAGVKINNDIFSARINGSTGFQMPKNSDDTRSTAWNSTVSSNWRKKFWPSLRINYGQSHATTEATPKTSDSESQKAGLGTSLDLLIGKIVYSYNTSTNTNNISRTESERSSQNANFATGHSFLNNRMQLSFSQGYSQSTSSTTRYIQPTGMVDLPVRVSVITSDIDSTPIFGSLSSSPALADDDLATVVLTVNAGDSINIGFSSDELSANRIYLYLDPTVSITAADAASLKFSLYSSPISDGNVWTEIATNLSPVYDNLENRYILDYNFNFDSTLLKLVATNWPTTPLSITELQIISRQPGASIPLEETKKSSSTTTTVGTSIQLHKDVPLNYTYSLSTGKSHTGAKSKNQSHAANLRWNLHKYCQPSLNMSTNISQAGSHAKNTSRSFGLSVSSAPIPTISIGFGATKNENFHNSTKLGSAKSYSLSLNAALYPDLSANLHTNHSESNSPTNGSSSTTWSNGLGLTARLSSKVTTSFSTYYNRNSTESAGGGKTGNTNKGGALSMNIRPSDILSLQFTAAQQWNDQPSPVNYNLSTSFALLRTNKTQISASYNYTHTGSNTTSSCSASWSWTLSRYLTMRTSGSFPIDPANSWSLQSQIATSF